MSHDETFPSETTIKEYTDKITNSSSGLANGWTQKVAELEAENQSLYGLIYQIRMILDPDKPERMMRDELVKAVENQQSELERLRDVEVLAKQMAAFMRGIVNATPHKWEIDPKDFNNEFRLWAKNVAQNELEKAMREGVIE